MARQMMLLLALVVTFAGIANSTPVVAKQQARINNNVKMLAAAVKPSYRSAEIAPMVAESKRRLSNLFARADMELRQLKTISNRAASFVNNRNMDSPGALHAAMDQQLVQGSRQRIQSLLRSADLEIRRLHKVHNRDPDNHDDCTGSDDDPPHCWGPDTNDDDKPKTEDDEPVHEPEECDGGDSHHG